MGKRELAAVAVLPNKPDLVPEGLPEGVHATLGLSGPEGRVGAVGVRVLVPPGHVVGLQLHLLFAEVSPQLLHHLLYDLLI